ncbi:DUF5020 family protein, partial [Bacteroides heparinolyticus]|uniref:DUF5020 family protein n=1 Tax=Prevotella heparinolytica TaxID=28113 RepID=UPI0035A027B0
MERIRKTGKVSIGNGEPEIRVPNQTKPDKWGSTFMFVDFDFSAKDGNMGLAYMEIARDFKIKGFPLMPHIEYNGGLGLVRNTDFGFSIPNAYLAGLS